MSDPSTERILFKRQHFTTRLPVGCLYSPTHYWLRETEPGVYRVGLTQFATRMLGEIVEFEFDARPEDEMAPGQVLGWIEGFKATSDIYSVATGRFGSVNAAATDDTERISKDPYDTGWLFSFRGRPDDIVTDVHGYVAHLDRTIDAMLASPWKPSGLGAPPPTDDEGASC